MCHSLKILSRVSSGELALCQKCNVYHLEFNNIYFEFTHKQFKQFKKYLLTIEEDYWEHKYASANIKRKIPIPSMQPNLILMFNKQEIKELKSLFYCKNKVFENYLSASDINYTLIVN